MNKTEGATTSMVIYSVIGTAKANAFNPFYYLTYLFEQLPNIDIKKLITVQNIGLHVVNIYKCGGDIINDKNI